MLLHQRANPADQRQKPQLIDMYVKLFIWRWQLFRRNENSKP